MSTTSPQWSRCPWVRKTWVGSTSPASTAALGLPLRKGSMRTRVSPSLISKHACPRKRMSMRSVSFLKLSRELPADSDADQHPHARLLGEEDPDQPVALGGVLALNGGAHLPLVGLAKPAALGQGLAEDALELGGEGRESVLGAPEALRVGQGSHGGLQLLVREHARDTTSVSELKLTALSHGAGCACKLPAAEVYALLEDLPTPDDDAVLVGAKTADDAAVYRVSDELALVSTADFFTPIVDDAYDFGRIAAANALSDVYAMGGRPLTALNLVAWSALKRGLAPDGVAAAAVETMARLNRDAASAALAAGASAMTDVTGFGLLGHLRELALASGVAAEVDAAAVPAIDGVLELLGSPEPPVAGGSRRNRDWVEPHVDWSEDVPEERRWLLCDAMTSGGLLVAAAPGSGGPGVRVGRLVDGPAGRIAVA